MLEGFHKAAIPLLADDDQVFVSASTTALFAKRVTVSCSVCGVAQAEGASTDWSQGALVWVRGGRVEHEQTPLCPACTAAVGVTVLTRRAIEEEEEG